MFFSFSGITIVYVRVEGKAPAAPGLCYVPDDILKYSFTYHRFHIEKTFFQYETYNTVNVL